MGGCLTAQREFKNQNEGSIQHHTMNAARRSTFWENAAVLEPEKKNTESELESTCRTWVSMNLYEYSTTQNARMTQSKMKSQPANLRDVEPSDTTTEVQKDFDINSPIATETFSRNDMENMFANTNALDDPQHSFEMTPAQSATDMAKVVSKSKDDSVPNPLQTSHEVGSMEVTEAIEKTAVDKPVVCEATEVIEEIPVNKPVMFDVAAQSYSTVDEFDEPKEGKPTLEQSVDSLEKLLADPTVQSPDGNYVMVNTASGRWGLISRDEVLENGRCRDQLLMVTYVGEEFSDKRRASSFEIRAFPSVVV